MKFVNVILLFIINLHYVEGFYIDSDSSEGIDFFPYLPTMYATGTCYFLTDKHYNIGDLQFFIYSDNPTINLYSPNYLTFSRRLHGMKYRMVNLKDVDPGLMCVKYTVSYIGWIRPQTWCSDILPYVPTTTETIPTDETTARPTTSVLPHTFDPITQTSSTPSTPTFDPTTSISTKTIPSDKTTGHATTTTLKPTFDPTTSTSSEKTTADKTTEYSTTTTLKPTFDPTTQTSSPTFDPTTSISTETIPTDKTTEQTTASTTTSQTQFTTLSTTSSPLPTSAVSTTISTSVPSPTTTSKIPTTPLTTSPSVPTTTLGTRKPLPDPSR